MVLDEPTTSPLPATRQVTQADFPASWRVGVWVCLHAGSIQILGGIPAIGA